MSDEGAPPPVGEIAVYESEDSAQPIRVRLEGDTVWLTQRQLADLYQTSIPNINQHISSIYNDGELPPEATLKKYLIVQTEGKRQVQRLVDHYNLDIIIAVGYRVKSAVATRFRQWATARLSEYLVKGFVLDDERLKGGGGLTDYFDELLERIRDIRASEARVYQRIREIFSLAADYREDDKETQRFFAAMQNKIHYAATGLTAAEIIFNRAKAGEPNMGLTNWKGGRVRMGDTVTAKNYLDAAEIDTLNRITVMFLDQAEFRAQRRTVIRMAEWDAVLDRFLVQTELPVLEGGGSIRHAAAVDFAHQQYDAYNERRRREAETIAEKRYVDDLRESAKTLEGARKRPHKKKANEGGEG